MCERITPDGLLSDPTPERKRPHKLSDQVVKERLAETCSDQREPRIIHTALSESSKIGAPSSRAAHFPHEPRYLLNRMEKIGNGSTTASGELPAQSAIAMEVRASRSRPASNGFEFSRKSAMNFSARGAASGSLTLSGSRWTPRTRNS